MTDATAVRAYTVRDFLDAELDPSRRIMDLQALAEMVTGQPLETATASLRSVLAGQITMEDFLRLHILISHLYHRGDATITEAATLRAEVDASLAHGDPIAPEPGVTTAARRPKSISPYCVGGESTSPQVHARCRGNGPMWLPGVPTVAPVLPQEACDCTCHTPTPTPEAR